jgi:hypothetical protein
MGIRERIATYRFAEKCAETSDKVIALWLVELVNVLC